jgi:DNA (cytosine-5)-methyltransferase 1
MFTLETKGQHAVAFAERGTNVSVDGDCSATMKSAGDNTGGRLCVQQQSGVRRLTPLECERLQGFPDDYTLVPYRGKPAADGPRYKALGNSMAVPVVRWIGERIARTETIQ